MLNLFFVRYKPCSNRPRFKVVITTSTIGLHTFTIYMQIAHCREYCPFFFPSFGLQLTVITKGVTVANDVIEAATVFVQIHPPRQIRIVLVARVKLRNLHNAAGCSALS